MYKCLYMDSLSYYEKVRQQLTEKLGGKCNICGMTQQESIDEYGQRLEYHHVNKEEGFESGCGGMNHLMQVRKQVRKGVEIELRCKSCHVSVHASDHNHFHERN